MKSQEFKVQSCKLVGFASLCAMLFALCFWADSCFGARRSVDESTTIDSETLDYDGQTFTYIARGQIRIKRGVASVESDEMRYNQQTSELTAEGNVVYEDHDVRIKAKRAKLNLDLKTGTLYEAEVYSKKDNYHIRGLEIERVGEKEYTLKNASFTTCDAPVPAWCFKGSDVNAIVGDRLKARNVTLNIEGLPVLYSPYFQTSLNKERKTGFLSPSVGYIKSKGIHVEQPFYWAISDNMDATFVADYYARRGAGEGIEFRFIEPDGSRGSLWAYHLRDKVLKEDFLDLRGFYDRERDANVTGYLNMNYVSSRDFYNEYNPYVLTKGVFLDPAAYLNLTTGRFFESTGDLSIRLDNSRLFLNSQYLVDLKSGVDQSTIAQRLPEAGYFVNPRRVGPVVFSLSSTLSNFWREKDIWGQRLDVYPKFSHSFGGDLVITQTLGLRETAYVLSRTDSSDSSPHREGLDYTLGAHTRLVKKYESFVHIVEPSLSYVFIPSVKADLPFFDSTELYTKTSTVQLSLTNRFMDSKGEFLTVRITQPYDFHKTVHSFLPLKVEAALLRPLSVRGEVSYDVNTGRVESVNSDVSITLNNKATFSLGERYSRLDNILFYTAGLNYPFSSTLSAEGSAWYDARGSGLRDLMVKLKYKKQCWAVNVVVTKREKDYSVSVLFDLLGLGTVKL
ncbi:MAG TPA: LPS assembly protein LptD [Thermodesulfovibrionales bacterium]|nr:LPS assembly protein LptD [Thermodesulfovibrionales bacterium]